MTTALDRLRAAAPTLSVGMVTANLLELGAEMRVLEAAGVAVVHFDVMDGVFCPMMTIGPPIVRAITTPMLKDVHLMVRDPADKVAAFAAAGADIITVHAEEPQALAALRKVGTLPNANDPARGIVRGIAIEPDTPIDALTPLLPEVDLVVVLAVRPGLSGQKFDPAAPERVAAVREAMGQDGLICIDGGITKHNLAEVARRTAADLVVTGSAVFDGRAAGDNAREMLATLAGA